MMGLGKEEVTMALLLVSGSTSLCSWQSQKENSPSPRCELSKCDDLSENVCVHVHVDVILYSQYFRITFLRT